MRTSAIVLAALAAGTLGVVAGLAINGPGPLLRTELGQRALQGAYSAVAPPAPEGLEVAGRGERIPELALPLLDGGTMHLPRDLQGAPVLVNFWASWCGPCIEEMPELDRFAAGEASHGVRVVGIALDEPAAVRGFLQRVPVRYPILLDTPGARDSSVQLGNPRGVLPYSVLLSADGRLLRQRVGPFAHGEIDRWAMVEAAP
jgi:thiol-disulfide isomerase/thioredoxin